MKGSDGKYGDYISLIFELYARFVLKWPEQSSKKYNNYMYVFYV